MTGIAVGATYEWERIWGVTREVVGCVSDSLEARDCSGCVRE